MNRSVFSRIINILHSHANANLQFSIFKNHHLVFNIYHISKYLTPNNSKILKHLHILLQYT